MTTSVIRPSLRPWDLPQTDLGRYVSSRASQLQSRYLAADSPSKAALAQLRNSISRPVGTEPATWAIMFDGFPTHLMGRDDKPSASEIAAHAALSIFAVHMQSATTPVQLNGIGIGRAVRRLSRLLGEDDQSSPVIRRFHALGTASDLPETLHHARGLIQQMRAASIGLDYGRLAEDLVGLQNPSRADGVRLRWARDLFRIDPTPDNETSNETKEEN